MGEWYMQWDYGGQGDDYILGKTAQDSTGFHHTAWHVTSNIGIACF
jgi:hypothetical protein